MLQSYIIRKMWLNSLVFSMVVYAGAWGYSVVYHGGVEGLTNASEAFAVTAGTLIGLSLALSGFCYYLNFLEPELFYRKFLGLLGYGYALCYCITLLAIYPEKYFYGFFTTLATTEMQLGIAAMAILTFLTFISNTRAMRMLGVVRWRYALRLGYLAYGMFIIRALLVEGLGWVTWLNEGGGLPPARLLLTMYALFVLSLRASMIVLKLPVLARMVSS